MYQQCHHRSIAFKVTTLPDAIYHYLAQCCKCFHKWFQMKLIFISGHDKQFFVLVRHGIDVNDVWFEEVVQHATHLMPQLIYCVKLLMTI